MTETVLILGGTREGAQCAERLVAEHPDWRIISSLAGRTREPVPPAGEVRIGGFGGIAGLVDFLRKERITRIVDATHPFARQISENAIEAARLAGIPLDILHRPPWLKTEGDIWIEVTSLVEARDAIPTGATVLLAIGSQHVGTFSGRDDVRFIVRMVDPPETPLPLSDQTLVLGKPSDDWREELALLERYGVNHIVCRNSGGPAAYAKIEAARRKAIPVVIVQRPAL